jgi:hypothetical protein
MIRPLSRLGISSILVGIFLAITPGPGLAVYCQLYAPNDGGGKVYEGTSVASGTSAHVDLSTAAVVSGQTVAHPLQIASNSSTDFVGWGTYRGTAGWADWNSNSSVCITDPPYYVNTLSATDFRVLNR